MCIFFLCCLLDVIGQLVRTVGNLKYEVREMSKKIDSIPQIISDTIDNNSSSLTIGSNGNQISLECIWDFPLKTLDDLEVFEEKLSDNTFKKRVVSVLNFL